MISNRVEKYKKIIVTGGAGFIGSHIVDAYIRAGHRVIVLDNLSTGFKKNLNSRAKFYKCDICDLEKVRSIFQKEKPDIINHHAAVAEVIKSMRDPLPTLKVNLLGTVNLLLCGGEVQIKKFIFASTGGAIYGDPLQLPVSENAVTQPLSAYGLSKLLSENAILFYSRMYGFKYTVFRYSNVYGSRQNPKGEAGVVAIFSEQMKNKKIPTIFGDGRKIRDYTHVSDIVCANILGLSRGNNTILNLGLGEKITDQKIFDILAKNFSFNKNPQYAPFRNGEVFAITLNAEKAQKILKWKPKIYIEKGIRLYIEESKIL